MKDRIILKKIESYLRRITPIYDTIKDLDEVDIVELNDAFALTQFITNIYSLTLNLSNDDIASKMFVVAGRGLSTCRNISAHDYDSLNWSKVKQLSKKLISEQSYNILEECIRLAESDEAQQRKYALEN